MGRGDPGHSFYLHTWPPVNQPFGSSYSLVTALHVSVTHRRKRVHVEACQYLSQRTLQQALLRQLEAPGSIYTSPSMSISQVLQRLYSLDKSSSEFIRVLYTFLRLDENGEHSLNLEQSESVRLVNFLDGV